MTLTVVLANWTVAVALPSNEPLVGSQFGPL
jgi:hypothetical protein